MLDDGVGFEASLPYHGLSLEMFLVAWHVAQLTGRPLSERYRVRLKRMLEVSRSVRHPTGRSPAFGDLDSGRLLPGGFARPATHDNLLDLGAAMLGLPRPLDAAPDAEVAWTLGLQPWRALAARPVESRPLTTAFPSGGLYVLQGGGAHMVVRWGGVGQNGNGGHAHNDLSSYELSYGTPIVVDPGAMCTPPIQRRVTSSDLHEPTTWQSWTGSTCTRSWPARCSKCPRTPAIGLRNGANQPMK